ncbi:MAG: class I SAM-dependent methyltransferase [Patescibacteria group bacterium]
MNTENLCKICGAKTREIFHEKFKIKYFECLDCDFIFKDEKRLITPEEELRIYNRHNNSIDDPRYVAYFKDFIEKAIIPNCANPKNVLDFGSGPSPVLAMILERDYNFSVDIYDPFYSPEKVYKNKKYDLIVSTEVVEHLKNPLDYFLKFKDLLVDGGFLCVMTLFHPNNDDKFKSWRYIGDKSHISFFTLKTMNFIAKKTKLNLTYSDNRRYAVFKK